MPDHDEDTAVTDISKSPTDVNASDCLVVIYQRRGDPGECFKLERSPIRIGRDPSNEIQLEDGEVSRYHARLERIGPSLVVMDVGSTNGTLLNNIEIEGTRVLKNHDLLKIGFTIFKYLSASDLEGALYEQIYSNVITDHLTQLSTKRRFEECLTNEFSRARRHKRPLSLLMIDIDRFKNVNDTYGHQAGDFTLSNTARVIQSSVRAEDVVARFGGEEIVALLPEANLADATAVAEKILAKVAESEIVYRDSRFKVTVSIGCAQLDANDTDVWRFFERADGKMYEAKEAGRNCLRS